ncbi:MAG: molybdopterin cofactor-binding domain-containing protein [Pseudomonadota bacterium]
MSEATAYAPADDDDAISFELNGRPVSLTPPSGQRLTTALRDVLGAQDVKVGCNAGDCGACTVLLDGDPVCACLVATHQAEGRKVETLAGLKESPEGSALRQSFLRHGAAQCGICTPGALVSGIALLRQTPAPNEAAAQEALAGVLCRCTGYRQIIAAVCDAASSPDTAQPAGTIGDPIIRLDGRAKVDGTEAFGDDVAPDAALIVKVVRSPHPHARFAFGDLKAYAARHRLAAVLTEADIPGKNVFGVIPPYADQPVFPKATALFRGEAVAAVVGEAEIIENLDLAHFPITFEPLPAAQTPADAQAANAPELHAGRARNVMCTGRVCRGDAASALASAHITVSGRFTTPFVEHAYIEPEAGFARKVGDRIEIHASTQSPVMDQEALAPILGLPLDKVRIVPTACGGGFGAKLDLSVQPFVALAALITGRPAKLAYTRSESMQSTTKRHPSDMTATIGATADGTVTAMRFEGEFDTGAYASWGPTVAVRVPVHASGPYNIPDYEATGTGVHTHNPPSGAFRGFGVPQSTVAQESLFEDLATALNIDPLEFRRRNALQNGEATVCGQVFENGVGISACLDALEPHWKRARAEADAHNEASPGVRRGVGIASGWYGCGNTGIANPSTIKAGVTADGTIILHQGATDIGQGSGTVIPQVFATALGVPVSALTLKGPDTDITPDAGKTSGSRQTFVSGNAARLAGAALRAELLRRTNAGADATITPGATLTVRDGSTTHTIDLSGPVDADGFVVTVSETYDPPTTPLDENGQGAPYALYGYAAHIVELNVDTALGTVELVKVTAAHDVGKAINPLLIEGQVTGGIAQGMGMALMEAFIPGVTENLHDYLIPTIGDVPPVETLIIEEPDENGPYGAKGLGEHALIPTAPAILNAIRHATGARITDLPATPDRVRAAIKALEKAE